MNDNKLHVDEAAVADELPPIPGSPAAPGDGAATPGQDTAKPKSDTGALIASLLDVTFNKLVAPKRGAHWQLSSDECDALGQAYGAVLDKRMPDFKTGPEITAVLVSVSVFVPRILQDAKTPRKPAAAEAYDPDIVIKGTDAGPGKKATVPAKKEPQQET